MAYIGHNVYGPRAGDFSVRTGLLDAIGGSRSRDGRVLLADVWCDQCFWRTFGGAAADAARADDLAQYMIAKDPASAYGSAHGLIGFYWSPDAMTGDVLCAECGNPLGRHSDAWREDARALIAGAVA